MEKYYFTNELKLRNFDKCKNGREMGKVIDRRKKNRCKAKNVDKKRNNFKKIQSTIFVINWKKSSNIEKLAKIEKN